ncbi:MAG: class I SAM-dependent methyltransferase [Bacteroidales bacterium]|jgi:SAM-dependent methyltransferase|nr:class I SAM-dependent methyltransferase [Bacteroidales bacterium]MDI9576189.1 class I SAM-dependent methyltransferase [Bacteroidota bacterium]MDD3756235.1 class I SAM-dependent methyltransferase [Bacteroidales bacterium]MDY0401346.1 class I SAM-dependent methyltransferase [Bacteroidales bacterium]HHW59569.1 class I SAM-dependent methyltransferase [Bacteroidales bacterium]
MKIECAYCLTSLNSESLFKVSDNLLYVCPECGSVTLAPNQHINIYPVSYFGSDTKKFSFPLVQKIIDIFQLKQGKRLAKWIDKDANVLDIGCGDGQLLTAISKKRRGKFIGIELENKALHRAKLNSKISVIAQDIFYYEPNLQFDIIICNHSFEHIGKPIQLMEQINKLLKTNGIFYINIPNTDSIQFHLFRSKWLHLDPPYHDNIPNIKKFIEVLLNKGFIIKKNNHWNFIHNISSFILSSGNYIFKQFNYFVNILKNPYPIFKNILYILLMILLTVLLIVPAILEFIISGLLKKGATVEIVAQKIEDLE